LLSEVGVKAGRIAAWLPGMLKPAAARMALALRGVHAGGPAPDAPTQSSFALKDSLWSEAMLHTAGYLRLGSRAVRADLAERLAGALSQIRRGSETSAFVVPPELSAQVGCPQAEFQGVLRALGLKPAEKDKETGAVKLWRFHSQRRPERHADNAGVAQGEVVQAESAPAVGGQVDSRKEGAAKRGRRRNGKRGPEREAPAAGGKPHSAPRPSRDKPRPPPPARPQPPPSGPFAVLAEMIIMQPQQRTEPERARRKRRRGKRPAVAGTAPKAAS
jgi:ATP-dependent RNA helicase SUPV3L1/SUV3